MRLSTNRPVLLLYCIKTLQEQFTLNHFIPLTASKKHYILNMIIIKHITNHTIPRLMYINQRALFVDFSITCIKSVLLLQDLKFNELVLSCSLAFSRVHLSCAQIRYGNNHFWKRVAKINFSQKLDCRRLSSILLIIFTN